MWRPLGRAECWGAGGVGTQTRRRGSGTYSEITAVQKWEEVWKVREIFAESNDGDSGLSCLLCMGARGIGQHPASGHCQSPGVHSRSTET